MAARPKASDNEILAAYDKAGSVWGAGKLLGMCGQSVHERLTKLGAVRPVNAFTMAECEALEQRYEVYAAAGKLNELAAEMGRTKQFLCRRAKELGLTNKSRPRTWLAVWKYLSEHEARHFMDAFKASRLGLGAYCGKMGFDDLGFSRMLKEHFPDEYEHVIEAKAPAQTMYRLGRSFEYRVRDHFAGLGYVVTRSPQSRSPVDLFCIGKSEVVFIQCKRGGSIGREEWNEFLALANSVGAKPLLARMGVGGRGIELFRITDAKDGSRRPQPMVPVKATATGVIPLEA